MTEASRLTAIDDTIDVEYSQFLLQDMARLNSAATIQPPTAGEWLLAGGRGGVLFHSAENDHSPAVRIELWAAEPGAAEGQWDAMAEDRFEADSTELLLWSITAAQGDHTLTLPAPGTYRVRAYVTGQAEIRAAGEASFAEGVERWLVQIWPA
ncbi:hypothetical protein ACRAKI_21945 [Saccharothrix isguenensis]